MKILKEGRVPEEEQITLYCTNCQTLFECGLSEMRCIQAHRVLGTVYIVYCQKCGRGVHYRIDSPDEPNFVD